MGFPILPQLSTTAEFFVLDLVAQHNPEPDSKFPGRRDPRLAHSVLDQLATIESFQLWVFSYGMQRRFGPQVAQQRIALLGQGPQPLSLAATVLTWDHPDITSHLLGGGKAARISEKHFGRQCRQRSHTRMRQQSLRLRSLLRLLFHLSIQFLDPLCSSVDKLSS
jgi:hypothetical protein